MTQIQSLHSLLKSAGFAVPQDLANPLIRMVTFDSRYVVKGSLFVGLPGERVDGGRFWPQAFSAGAEAAVISPEAAQQFPPDFGDAVVVMQEPLAHWAGMLAAAFWQNPSSKMALIGVTGTNGKTTTTYLIEYLSAALERPTALFGTLVNRWPGFSAKASHTTAFADSLQANLAGAVRAGAQFGVMEVSSHALDQHRVSGCRFKGAVFTNLTQDHLDYHSSMENYFAAKARLFEAPFLIPGRDRAVVNVDNSWGVILADQLGDNCWRSSLSNAGLDLVKAELRITDLKKTNKGVKGRLHSPVGEGCFESTLIGDFNMMNLLQSVGVLLQQGFPLPQLLKAIPDFPGVPGRMEQIKVSEKVSGITLPKVLVDYAHTPDGLKNALIAARSFTEGELICVFGCGGDRDKGKRSKMGAIAAQLADRLVVTSDNPRTEEPQQILRDVLTGIPIGTALTVEENRSIAIQLAVSESGPGDVVLIAGKGHEDYQILGTEKVYFDDRKEALGALNRILGS